jgi:hypothetical protein
MGRGDIFITFSLLVEIEGHFNHEFVPYVYGSKGSKEKRGDDLN